MVGKIEEEVRKEKLFDEVTMAMVSQNLDVRRIQAELAVRLNLNELLGEETELGRAGLLKKRLKDGRKILVILDDVWEKLDLKKIIEIEFEDNDFNCKFLLTSRSLKVCEANSCQKSSSIEFLKEGEAWDMFKKKAGNCVDDTDIRPVAENVCKECGGLPLIIQAVGAALKDKDGSIWRDALQHFRNYHPQDIGDINPEVFVRLELSYNYLAHEEQRSCLLLCSLFPDDADISIVDLSRHAKAMGFLRDVDTLEQARIRMASRVDTLKASSLLLQGKDEETIKMHDVIRDVAISIASKDKKYKFLVKTGVQKWPEMDNSNTKGLYKAISIRSYNNGNLPDKLEYCPELHTLVLECSIHSLRVPDTFFNALEKLRVLNLCRMSIRSFPNLPSLRMLCLDNCKLEDMSAIKELKKLEMLRLSGDYITELPLELRQLTGLQLLDLRDCGCLNVIAPGILSSLSCLEELYFHVNFRCYSILDELSSSLTCLELHLPDLMIFPKELVCKNLTRFKISVGKNEIFSESYSSTKTLKIGTNDSVDPNSKVNILLWKAEELTLERLKGLQWVHDESSEEAFVDLKYLLLKSICDMEYMNWVSWNHRRPTPRPFSKLIVLTVSECGFQYLFSESIARCLVQLQSLEIEECKFMEEIVRHESKGEQEESTGPVIFDQLKSLKLKNLPSLRSLCQKTRQTSTTTVESSSTLAQPLFNGMIAFPGLKELKIDDVHNVREIWENRSSTEDSTNGYPQNLTTLEIRNLTTLEIRNCGSLSHICSPSVARNLVHLKDLSVDNCKEMVAIIASTAGEEIDDAIVFPQLWNLVLESLPKLKIFWYEEKAFEEDITQTNPLFNYQIAFPCLELLWIQNLNNVREIWENRSSTEDSTNGYPQNLTNLFISDCGTLSHICSPSVARNLVHFEYLSVDDCEEMEAIIASTAGEEIDDAIVFPQLKELSLKRLPKLKVFWSEGKAFEEDITQTNPFFNYKVAMPVLKELVLRDLKNIREVWENKCPIGESFCHLRELDVVECDILEKVIPSSMLQRLQNLKKLVVRKCYSVKVIFDITEEIVRNENKGNEEEIKEFYYWPSHTSLCHQGAVIFHQLTHLELSFVQPLFNEKVAFPSLEVLGFTDRAIKSIEICRVHLPNLVILLAESCYQLTELVDIKGLNVDEGDVGLLSRVRRLILLDLPNLHRLWNKDPCGIRSFRSLTDVLIYSCGHLRNLFSCSVARALQQLRVLVVISCPKLKEIVADDEEVMKGEIVFPRLKLLRLENLPELTSFCSANIAFNLPSIKWVALDRCPQMQIFTIGQLSTPSKCIGINTPNCELPPIKCLGINARDCVEPWNFEPWNLEHIWITDLSNHVQQQSLNGNKRLAMDENTTDGIPEDFLQDEERLVGDFICNFPPYDRRRLMKLR